MSLNTTGLYDTNELSLGRGIVRFADLDPVTQRPLAFFDVGNIPTFDIEMAQETLEHTSSREGLASVDKRVTLSRSANTTLNLQNINLQNLARFFGGQTTKTTNAAVAGFAKRTVTDSLELGRSYVIADNNGERAYRIDHTKLTVEVGPSSPTTPLVAGVDYTLDAEFGTIFIRHSTLLATNGDKLAITLAADPYAPATVDQVTVFTKTEASVAILFIAENPANTSGSSQKKEYFFPKVTLTSEGTLSLIGDDWSEIPLTGVIERNEVAYPGRPFGWVTSVPPAV